MPNAELLQSRFWRNVPYIDIFSIVQATTSWFPRTLDSLVITNIVDWMEFTLVYRMPLPAGSPQPHQREAPATLKAAGHSEKSHCGSLSSPQRLHFMTEIKHPAHSRMAFGNYALMMATQASSLVISLWPLPRASQFGHFFNAYFLDAYHVLGTVLRAGSVMKKRDMAPPSWNLPWIKGLCWMHTGKSVSRNPTFSSSLTAWLRAQGQAVGHVFPGIWILPRILLQFCSQGHFGFTELSRKSGVLNVPTNGHLLTTN